MARSEEWESCTLCGARPARGFAFVDESRVCHGDAEPGPTCYEVLIQARGLLNDWPEELRL